MKILGYVNLGIYGEVFAHDCEITIPQNGLPLRVNHAETMWLEEGDVEIVADPVTGGILYFSLTANGFEKVMEEMEETWEQTSSEEKSSPVRWWHSSAPEQR